MAPITNPARLLAGYTFALPSVLRCYVLGCCSAAIVGRFHKMYGPVDACPQHDPESYGYALPLYVTVPPPGAVLSTPDASTGGALVPVPVVPPTRPPSPARVEINF